MALLALLVVMALRRNAADDEAQVMAEVEAPGAETVCVTWECHVSSLRPLLYRFLKDLVREYVQVPTGAEVGATAAGLAYALRH